MEEYNHRMSAIRTAVEWLFGDVVNSIKFNDFQRNLKIFLNILAWKADLDFFDLTPPRLEDYFA